MFIAKPSSFQLGHEPNPHCPSAQIRAQLTLGSPDSTVVFSAASQSRTHLSLRVAEADPEPEPAASARCPVAPFGSFPRLGCRSAAGPPGRTREIARKQRCEGW